MGAIASLSDLVNRCTGGGSGAPQLKTFFKDSRVGAGAAAAPVAGRMSSLWEYNGSPSHGIPPTTVAVPTEATDGGLKQTDPSGGRQLWLLGGGVASTAVGTLLVYDRLLHIGGLSGTSTSAQTVGGTLTRYTGALAAGNEIWIEIYTQIGGSSTTVTAIYTDQGGAGGTTVATAIGNTGLREAQRIIRLPLAQGDTGVRGVTSVTLAATTGVVGNFGVSIVRPLLWLPCGIVGGWVGRETVSGLNGIGPSGPPEVLADACLAMAWLSNGTTIPQLEGHLHLVEA